jgi:hypothetical protein
VNISFASVGTGLTGTELLTYEQLVYNLQFKVRGFDLDAQNFFTRVIAAGGILSANEQLAIDVFVKQMKAEGLWTKMKAIYPMVGGGNGITVQRQSACSQNLKSTSFTGTFSGGWTYSSNGVQGNGTTGEFLSNFALNNFSTKNSVAFGLYSRTNLIDVGVGMYGKSQCEFYSNYNALGQAYSYLFDGLNDSILKASYLGLNSHSRISSSQKYIQINNTITSFTSNVNTTDLDSSIVKFSRTGQGFDPNQYALYYISDGLNNNELSTLYNVVETFQTTLGRQV